MKSAVENNALFLEMYSASQSHYVGDLDYYKVFHCDENIKPTKIIFYSTLSPQSCPCTHLVFTLSEWQDLWKGLMGTFLHIITKSMPVFAG